MENERLQILKMLQDNKITAEEASKLLNAVDEPTTLPSSGGAKWLRVKITDINTGKAKVNVNLPISLIDVAVTLGMKYIPEGTMGGAEAIDFKQIVEAVRHGAAGKLVEVEDDDEGVRVEVIVE